MSDSPSSQPSNAYLEELMSGYVLNTLSPEETAEFERYLHNRPDLADQMQQMQEVMGWLAHASKMPAPSQLRSKILAIPQTVNPQTDPPQAAAQRTPSRVIAPLRWQGSRWQGLRWQGSWWSWQKIGTVMAALLILGLGVDNLLLRQRLTLLQAEETEDHQDFFTFELKGIASAKLASAKVVVDAHAGEVMVGAKNLPPLPEGEAYHLWAFTDDQNKVLCGRFNTDSAGQFVDRFSVDPAIYDHPIQFMRISREPAVTPPDLSRRKLLLTSES